MGIVKGLIGINARILSTLIVILAVVLLARGSRLGYITMPNEEVGIIFLYSIVSLILALFSGFSLMQTGYGFVYQAASFMQIYLLWNIDFDNDMDYYAEIGFWFCGVFCLIMLILLLKKTGGSLFVNGFESEDGENLFNRSTIGSIGFKSFVMSLAFKPNSKVKAQFRRVFLLVSLVVVIASTRRGIYLATIASCLLHYRNCKSMGKGVDVERMLKKVIFGAICISAFLFLYSRSSFIRDTLGHAGEMLVNGIRTFLGIDNSDLAAAMRTSKAAYVMDQYLYHSTPKQVLLGRGYMTTWVDMPFLQAFWDLGLVGGITFAVIQFVIPLKYMLKKTDSQGMWAAQYLTFMSLADGIASGYPYGRFFNAVLLITIDTAHRQGNDNPAQMQHITGGRL